MVLTDRQQAGKLLAEKLKSYQDKAIVYALPRGGVAVGAEIAQALKAPLDIIVSRKIGHPLQPEFGIAAVTESGHLVENEKYAATVDQNWLSGEIERQKTTAQHRKNIYRPGLKEISAKDKVAILVDDGIATGLTTKAAIEDLKSRGAQKIVVAVPVSPKETAEEIRKMVDELVALDIPDEFLGAVGAYYEEFPQVSDEEVVNLLKQINEISNY